MEDRDRKSGNKGRIGLQLEGWGWINRQQEMKTGCKDGVGTEGRRVMGVVRSKGEELKMKGG